jgi:signal transduction histidine kinase
VNILAHELRNPLNTLNLLVAYLKRRLPNREPEIDEILGDMTDAVGSMGDLLTDLLDYLRLDSGREVVRPEAVRLGELAEAATASLRPSAARRGSELSIRCPDGAMTVLADRAKCRRIIGHLVAASLADGDGAGVGVRIAADGPEGWAITVEDSGPARNAAADGRGPPASRTALAAVGLGIAEASARLMGGRLSFDNGPGRRRSATVRLPLDVRTAVSRDRLAEPMPGM